MVTCVTFGMGGSISFYVPPIQIFQQNICVMMLQLMRSRCQLVTRTWDLGPCLVWERESTCYCCHFNYDFNNRKFVKLFIWDHRHFAVVNLHYLLKWFWSISVEKTRFVVTSLNMACAKYKLGHWSESLLQLKLSLYQYQYTWLLPHDREVESHTEVEEWCPWTQNISVSWCERDDTCLYFCWHVEFWICYQSLIHHLDWSSM